MGGHGVSSDQVIAKLIEMGFDNSDAMEAVKKMGPSFQDAFEYILNDSCRKSRGASTNCSIREAKTLGKRKLPTSSSLSEMRQSSILDHFRSDDRLKRSSAAPYAIISGSEISQSTEDELKEPCSGLDCNLKTVPESLPVNWELDIALDWEQKVNSLLQKQFGYSSLKTFQKEALAAWIAHKDCLVLAATGSGKSLCFQIPALLTGEVVVVISPLISLMHDQCLKLSKHGMSACFLGSGQPDSSVERKAMRGMYNVIYVCPETVLRLIKPLQSLAESCGIALFAIDEVHCVSKWGHDFRPDYRRLSLLRENFSSSNLKFLKFDIPLMALTATATIRVREDILESLCMSKQTKIVLTSFFRSNLQFSVKHSRTSSASSYKNDFHLLIDTYTRKRKTGEKEKALLLKGSDYQSDSCNRSSIYKPDEYSPSDLNNIDDDDIDGNYDEANSMMGNGSVASKGEEMSVEYLEYEVDVLQSVDDWDVPCGGFNGQAPCEDWDIQGSFGTIDPPHKPEEKLQLVRQPLEEGPTIIYVPTRKETVKIAKYLCGLGVKAAAYNASLPKSHLRRVHQEFHSNVLQVVVATIAFGMGIDKSNVRRIIHYGWPQSLEAYYQEAGRAGRDGQLADCILYANLSSMPSLLPSRRSEEQTKQACRMLSDCFRYGMNTSCCRAKILVDYFGEDFTYEKCQMCDVCVNGPPQIQNLKEEADILMQVIAAYHEKDKGMDFPSNDVTFSMEKPNLRMFVTKIREQSHKFMATDLLWWRGLARIMEEKGYIREGDDKIHVQIKYPEPTDQGLKFLQSNREQTFYVHPEADMLLSMEKNRSYSSFSEWGKGWAEPEIRCQRLNGRQLSRKKGDSRKPRKLRIRKSRKSKPDLGTVRGRIAAKLTK